MPFTARPSSFCEAKLLPALNLSLLTKATLQPHAMSWSTTANNGSIGGKQRILTWAMLPKWTSCYPMSLCPRPSSLTKFVGQPECSQPLHRPLMAWHPEQLQLSPMHASLPWDSSMPSGMPARGLNLSTLSTQS